MTTDITVNWDSSTDPIIGWRVYLSQAGAPLGSQALAVPSSRTFTFHNINPGLVEVGVSRVDSISVDGVDTPIQGDVIVAATVIPNSATVPESPSTVTLSIG